ncbi:glutamate-5-semialdehyde dehydrogenase [Eubacterium uniforme]|uniref:Gamma-glutamyl phosphate reductase n=1 Tax=Eubacterium uniforme TaxID=39495 RepID=A0A1T4V9Y6_9FIRM|nr:glutamate-5-semialdehyde dehydrogenase [Eubacterium uniforme]SKA61706.1 glutamate-5-semialdehyde dehydrogenase [Eubacterium uniforme]HAH19214.1 glutamate-5-semialdehyde dehydrogenase [Eubacterium sp.]HAV91343.1 glutamate-5-semialdehyde dehydrogenase [Eubacterium sp.]
MDIKNRTKAMKLAAPILAATTLEQRNEALANIAKELEKQKDAIFAANKIDLDEAAKNNIAASIVKRLKFDDVKLRDAIQGIKDLINLPDPLGKVLLKRELDKDFVLTKVSVPLGVIGVIFEARPDALVQISSLCLKSGNCAILKGGKETTNTNRTLFEIIKNAASASGLPDNCLLQAEAHSEIDELLSCDESVDLLIPRGSNSFVRYIMENTKIPVMGHSSGICHIYVDEFFDLKKSIPVIVDSKIQYAAACNAVETILFNRKIDKNYIKAIAQALIDANVKLRGSRDIAEVLGNEFDVEVMHDDEFGTEYNDLIVSLKFVSDINEAVTHINTYGSHHTDCILTEDKDRAAYFTTMVDSASVYVNASTRFADGFRYGFGAEVGISTGKIHARGPVGLDGLITYKYKLEGDGEIVADYASGEKKFHHKDL